MADTSRFHALVLTGLLYLSISPLEVQAGSLNSLCQRAHLSSFHATGFEPRFDSKINYCEQSSANVPSLIKNAIQELSTYNRKIARFLGVTTKELFPEGVHFRLEASAGGIIDSAVGLDGIIRISEFSDWNGEPVNAGVYAHEIGHLITQYPNPAIPSFLAEIAQTHQFVEAFADLIALGSVGEIISYDPRLGSTKILRHFTPQDTYAVPTGDFQMGRAGVEFGKYCRFAQKQALPYGIKMCSEAAAKFPQVDYDPTPFEPDERLMKPFALFYYDPHFLGVPLVSFYLKLHQQTKTSLRDLIIEPFRKVEQSRVSFQYQCQAPLIPQLNFTVDVRSFEQVLLQIRDDLRTAGQNNLFEEAWKTHGMDIGFRLASIHALINAQSKSMMIPEYSDVLTKPEVRKGICFENGTYNSDAPGCSLQCLKQ